MDKIDNSEYFAGLDEMEKSQFIGNFFMWVKNQFVKQKVEPKQVGAKKPEIEKIGVKKPEAKTGVNKTESKKTELK